MHWQAVDLCGFGRLTRAPALACAPHSREALIDTLRHTRDNHGLICHGGGRSYGDAALNSGGRVILTAGLNRVLSFDPDSGEIVCEPGVTFHDLLRDFLPRGFVAPVSPGTGYATIGGAVANDIHGKNHDRHGSFGDQVRWIDLLLPCGEVARIGPQERGEWFAATIGGLGLTGVILAVCFALRRVPSNAVVVRERRIPHLTGFFEAFEEARGATTYSVAWIDGLARAGRLGRGVLETAEPTETPLPARPRRRLRLPLDLPAAVLNRWS
ncbi:MAG: FAD-binding oxidoreductase, partial [Burkholderiales bacterium]